ncbi:hypothetical protein L1887_05893 [Cichorium endivia]|nr:hypothetical protein L1887_05893 [Cichorium endivia]
MCNLLIKALKKAQPVMRTKVEKEEYAATILVGIGGIRDPKQTTTQYMVEALCNFKASAVTSDLTKLRPHVGGLHHRFFLQWRLALLLVAVFPIVVAATVLCKDFLFDHRGIACLYGAFMFLLPPPISTMMTLVPTSSMKSSLMSKKVVKIRSTMATNACELGVPDWQMLVNLGYRRQMLVNLGYGPATTIRTFLSSHWINRSATELLNS